MKTPEMRKKEKMEQERLKQERANRLMKATQKIDYNQGLRHYPPKRYNPYGQVDYLPHRKNQKQIPCQAFFYFTSSLAVPMTCLPASTRSIIMPVAGKLIAVVVPLNWCCPMTRPDMSQAVTRNEGSAC